MHPLLSQSRTSGRVPVMPEHLMGQTEIADLLGVSRQRAQQLYRDGLLPPVYDTLAMGPVWLKVDIEKWARETGRLS